MIVHVCLNIGKLRWTMIKEYNIKIEEMQKVNSNN